MTKDSSAATEVKDSAKQKTKSDKKKKFSASGVVSVCATFNNTIITISDTAGNVLCWSSAGKEGFKGSKKATPYAAQVATQKVIQIAKDLGMQTVVVKVKGPGVGREASLRAIHAVGMTVTSIIDRTYYPHNGCRPPKRRRV